MTGKLSERLARRALIMSDTAQMKTQFPEWLLREMEQGSDDLAEAARIVRAYEDAPVAYLHGKTRLSPRPAAIGLSGKSEHGKRVKLVEVPE